MSKPTTVGLDGASQGSTMYRAFLEQESHDPSGGMIYSYAHPVGGNDGMRKIRFENTEKYERHIDVDTIVRVSISKATDTGDTVITLTDVDGKVSSLWVHDEYVTGVTPY